MKPWVAPFIILWAVLATAAAVFFSLDEPEPPVAAPDEAESTALESYADRSTRRLKRRVEQLSAALSSALPSMSESVSGDEEGTASASTPSAAERVLALMDELTRLEESDEWTSDKWAEISREQDVLLASDPATHIALMGRLREAPDEDAAHDVLSLLTENPFTQFIHDAETIKTIHAAAREMLDDERPHLRAAAARVLYAYGSYGREDVLIGLARLGVESDPQVWDDLLAELAVAAQGYGLTEAEARPLVHGLREHCQTPDGGWAAGSLARWTTSEADLRLVTTLLHDAKGDRAQQVLNALDRETRLAGAFPDATRDLLLGVLQDPAREQNTRGLAGHFLRGYSPWDEATAEIAHRFSGF